jgi:hypothetical protein
VVWEQIINPSPITCSLVAVTGTAAGGFSTPRVISSATTCFGWNKLAVNNTGQAVAVEGVPGILSGPVIGISRDTNGTWGAPVTLEAQQYRQRQPRIGLGDDGTAVSVWTQRSTISYAVRSPNGVWGAATLLPNAANITNTSDIAVDGSGNAMVIYQQYQLPAGTLANYRPAGGSWMTPVVLTSGGGSAFMVRASPAGTFVVGLGDTAHVWLPGSSTFHSTAFSGGLTGIAVAPGIAIALVGPQVSVSTAAVP